MTASFHILYLVHDLNDHAVARRCAMLIEGGAKVTLAGFRRGENIATPTSVYRVLDFGQTYNGSFIQRFLSVLGVIGSLHHHDASLSSVDCILARNLEMLAIAVRGKKLCKPSPSVVYECLDIHRLMLGQSTISKMLRKIEGRLCKSANALITSSPAFIHEYFEKRTQIRLPTYLIENKVYPAHTAETAPTRTRGKPWVIGWFGALRCAKSFDILQALVKESNGNIQLVMRGRPAHDQLPHFEDKVHSTPGISFTGPYRNPQDLSEIYNQVHFTWAIDMFEEGLNSSWLLPNRLYEGCAFASVPIAAAGTETGRTLDRLGIGMILAEPKLASLKQFFANLTPDAYEILEAAVQIKPRSLWISDTGDCLELVKILKNFSPTILRKTS